VAVATSLTCTMAGWEPVRIAKIADVTVSV